MKVLITGGSGLLGNGFKNIISNHELIFLSSKDCDLTKYNDTYNCFFHHKPDYIIHLAAYVGGLFKNMNQKVEMFEKNIVMNHNVLKCSHELNIKKVVSCLSTCIFPDNTTYPINESMLHNGPPHHSNDSYAYAKRMLEIQSKAYKYQYGDNFICVIPTNIYGEHDNFDLENGHVIPSLIHKCYLAKQNNQPFVVYGTGKPLRQFIYARDLAQLIMWVLDNYDDTIILSDDESSEISIRDIAMLIAKEFDYVDKIEFDETYSDGQYKKTADNSKLKELYKDFTFTTIDDGIKKSVQWFKENYSTCRK